MEIVRFVCCTRVSASRNFLACVRGCSFRRGAFVARSFSASQSYSKKQDFPSVDGFSPVLESTTDPTLVNELATHGGDLASLGLGGITPVGLLQNMLEMVHVHLGLPWWASIALCTVTMRALMFPLVLHLQKNTIRMNNIRPDMQKMMEKVKEYKAAGNNEMVAVESANLLKLFEKNDCSPAKLFLAPLVQAPIFISFFLAIRQMAYAPVVSMKEGGLFWFTDLTLTDPFYVLPITNAILFMISLELGGDLGVTTPQMETMKKFLRACALTTVIVTAYFPTGLFMYWMTSSMFSLGQVLILRQPSLREKLGIPEAIHHPLPGFGNPFSKHSGTTASKTVSEFIGEIMLLVALSKSFLIM